MESSYKEIISKLKFIGKIQTGEKVNVKFMFLQPDNILTSFSRSFYYQDNRGNTINFVRNTIYNSFKIIEELKLSENIEEQLICKHIVLDLETAISGLENLKTTYTNDIMFCCDMDVLTDIVGRKLIEFKNMLNIRDD